MATSGRYITFQMADDLGADLDQLLPYPREPTLDRLCPLSQPGGLLYLHQPTLAGDTHQDRR